MTAQATKVIIHMVASLDGYIEGEDGDISWLEAPDSYDKGISDEDSEKLSTEVLNSIDCYVVGSRTYEMAIRLGWPYGDTSIYVFTTRDFSDERESVRFVSDDNKKLIHDIRQNHKNIWLVGGSELVKNFIESNLADEICITFTPYLLGKGTSFFDNLANENALHLKDVIAFKNGFVELWYEIKK
ncbi:MAG: dihydrofolate reductase family protein [Gammaproteobacteria bacterium]|nr:dihydrofolate reductase family protein [Gammaproteobacteria bacterium]MDD9896625.1 dihydrofolate reductase family protein [Gammaproteobacteria bacterium]